MWTGSVCFLCVKSFKNENTEKTTRSKLKSNAITTSFGLFCERFLKLPPESPLISNLCSKRIETQSSSRTSPSSSSFLDQFCSGCIEILQATFQLYNELCEVQLKMAWRLGQWEALLSGDATSKPSSKLSSLLYKKLTEKLDLGMGSGVGEVRKIRNLLLSHCNNTRNEMLGRRNLQVVLDRCSVPFPVPTQGYRCNLNNSGSTTTFLALDSTSDTPFPNERDVVVKRKPEDDSLRNHEDDDDDHHHEDFEAVDYKTDFDFWSSNNQKQDSDLKSMPLPSTMAESGLRRFKKKTQGYFSRKATSKKVKTPKIKKEEPKNTDGIPCDACGKMIPSIKQLLRHHDKHNNYYRQRHKGKRPLAPFQCHFCWQTFTTQQMRWVHQEIGRHDKSMTYVKFTCSEEGCTEIPPFSTFEDLETHFENVHRNDSESVHKCSLCSWPFSSDDMRQVHELVHGQYIRGPRKDGQNLSFKCPRCSQDFQTFAALQTHFISEHTDLDNCRIHKCPKCSMSYSLPMSLAQHLLTHKMEEDLATGSSSGKVYHVCEECGKQCATYYILQQHKRSAHRTTQCNLCGEIRHSKQMSEHMKRVHNVGIKPEDYCPICGKFFSPKSKMKQHMQSVHLQHKEPEGDEVCHICSKKFQRKGLLHRHLRIAHQIEAEELKRPARFVCPDCGMGYYYKTSLDNHVDAKHRSSEDRKYHFPCTLCSKTFWRKCVLRKHLEEAHGQDQVKVQD